MGVGTGGYGALMAAQNAPDAFVGAAAVNPVLDVACLYGTDYEPKPEYLFGEKEALVSQGYSLSPSFQIPVRLYCDADHEEKAKQWRRTARKSQWKMSAAEESSGRVLSEVRGRRDPGMTLMQFHIQSKVLQMGMDVWALLPDQPHTIQEPLKVLWLLHGGSGDQTGWVRNTSIEAHAGKYNNLAVILPHALSLLFCGHGERRAFWGIHRQRTAADYARAIATTFYAPRG